MTRPERFAVLHRHLSAQAAVSGGAWLAELPLANVLREDPGRVARSVSADPSTTQFTTDLGYAQPIGGVAVSVPNITPGAEFEIDGSNSPGFFPIVFTTGRRSVPGGRVAPQSLDWFHPGFWLGVLERDADSPWPTNLVALPPNNGTSLGTARYVRVRIFDPGNKDGYVEVGPAVVSCLFRPSRNYLPDANRLTVIPITQRVESKAGARRHVRYAHRRNLAVGWAMLPREEGFAAFDMISRAGIDRLVFVVPDPADDLNGAARSFFATFAKLDSWSLVKAFRGGKAMMAFGLEFEEAL